MRDTCHMDYADVLMLGAGLAGMRAAVAALEENPALRVVVARNMEGPSGSSFANVNNTLGIQVPETEEERDVFVGRVLEMGAPGYVAPGLVSLMAAEGVTRFNDLRRMGVPFRADKTDGLQRLPGCFLPQSPTCYILNDIAAAYDAFARRFAGLGGRYLSGMTVTDLVSGEENDHGPAPVLGVLARPMNGGPALAVQAKAVVMALGGPSPLFSRDTSGSGNSGFAYALMLRAGARLANTGYLQFLWHRTDNGRFFPVQSLAHPGILVRTPKNEELPVPESLRRLVSARKDHCPFGNGRGHGPGHPGLPGPGRGPGRGPGYLPGGLPGTSATPFWAARFSPGPPSRGGVDWGGAHGPRGQRRGDHRRTRPDRRSRPLRLRRMRHGNARGQPPGRGHGPGHPGLRGQGGPGRGPGRGHDGRSNGLWRNCPKKRPSMVTNRIS